MQTYEYKAVPAPNRPKRVKGVKTTAGRFAALLTETMNDQAKEGWEYMRSDSLPVEEKPGFLRSRVETYHTILIFRRPLVTSEKPKMAGYIEDQSSAGVEPMVKKVEPASKSAAEPESTEKATTDAQDKEERRLSTSWAEGHEDRFPKDPPMRGKKDDSPFAEPEDKDDQIIR